MKSPINFRDWLFIALLLFILGVAFLILEQIPFVESILNKISDLLNIDSEYIMKAGIH